tara:strand:- start:831 stop:1268 length:438 start_codon:yes stop_codon:yes gene_type:complete
MKKEEMVIGRGYLHCEAAFNETYFFKSFSGCGSGLFKSPIRNRSYDFTLSNVTEAKPEFQLDDEIEISCNENFTDTPTKGKFKNLDPEGNYWIADENGFMVFAEFARKVAPMVTVRVFCELVDGWRERKIPKALADQIFRTGEVS